MAKYAAALTVARCYVVSLELGVTTAYCLDNVALLKEKAEWCV